MLTFGYKPHQRTITLINGDNINSKYMNIPEILYLIRSRVGGYGDRLLNRDSSNVWSRKYHAERVNNTNNSPVYMVKPQKAIEKTLNPIKTIPILDKKPQQIDKIPNNIPTQYTNPWDNDENPPQPIQSPQIWENKPQKTPKPPIIKQESIDRQEYSRGLPGPLIIKRLIGIGLLVTYIILTGTFLTTFKSNVQNFASMILLIITIFILLDYIAISRKNNVVSNWK